MVHTSYSAGEISSASDRPRGNKSPMSPISSNYRVPHKRRPQNLTPLATGDNASVISYPSSVTGSSTRTTSPRKVRGSSPNRERTYADANGQIRIRSPRGQLRYSATKQSSTFTRTSALASILAPQTSSAGNQLDAARVTDSPSTESSSGRDDGPPFNLRRQSKGRGIPGSILNRSCSAGDAECFVEKLSSEFESHESPQIIPLAVTNQDVDLEVMPNPLPPRMLRRHQSMVEEDLSTMRSPTPLETWGGSLKWTGAVPTAGPRHGDASSIPVNTQRRPSMRRRATAPKQPRSRSTERATHTMTETWTAMQQGGSFRSTRRKDPRASPPDPDILSSSLLADFLPTRTRSLLSDQDCLSSLSPAPPFPSSSTTPTTDLTADLSKDKRAVILLSLWRDSDLLDRVLIVFLLLLLLVTSAGILLLEPRAAAAGATGTRPGPGAHVTQAGPGTGRPGLSSWAFGAR